MAERWLGQYQLVKQLATGGMAEIYLATVGGVEGFEKRLALKVIHPNYSEDPDFVRMLVDEAKLAVQLQHGNIVQTFDLGKIDGTYYIAMELVDGLDLFRVLRRSADVDRDMPFEMAAYIAAEVCEGLDYAHRKADVAGRPLQIVHRDISPQNVLVGWSGEVKICDFGIAKAAHSEHHTAAGVIKGKYYYMAPEQAWGDPTDARTDIFSAGILLYEMIAGQMLYLEENIERLLDQVRRADIVPVSKRRAGVPRELEAIVTKALKKKPTERWQSAASFGQALTAWLRSYAPDFAPTRVGTYISELAGLPGEETSRGRDPHQSTAEISAAVAQDAHSLIFRLPDMEGTHSGQTGTRHPAPRVDEEFDDGDYTSVEGEGGFETESPLRRYFDDSTSQRSAAPLPYRDDEGPGTDEHEPATAEHRAAPAIAAQDGAEPHTGESYAPEAGSGESYALEAATGESYVLEVATGESYAPEAASGESYVLEVATDESYVPEAATGESYVPEVATGESYAPEAATSESYVPEVGTGESYAPEVATEEHYTDDAATASHALDEPPTEEHTAVEVRMPPVDDHRREAARAFHVGQEEPTTVGRRPATRPSVVASFDEEAEEGPLPGVRRPPPAARGSSRRDSPAPAEPQSPVGSEDDDTSTDRRAATPRRSPAPPSAPTVDEPAYPDEADETREFNAGRLIDHARALAHDAGPAKSAAGSPGRSGDPDLADDPPPTEKMDALPHPAEPPAAARRAAPAPDPRRATPAASSSTARPDAPAAARTSSPAPPAGPRRPAPGAPPPGMRLPSAAASPARAPASPAASPPSIPTPARPPAPSSGRPGDKPLPPPTGRPIARTPSGPPPPPVRPSTPARPERPSATRPMPALRREPDRPAPPPPAPPTASPPSRAPLPTDELPPLPAEPTRLSAPLPAQPTRIAAPPVAPAAWPPPPLAPSWAPPAPAAAPPWTSPPLDLAPVADAIAAPPPAAPSRPAAPPPAAAPASDSRPLPGRAQREPTDRVRAGSVSPSAGTVSPRSDEFGPSPTRTGTYAYRLGSRGGETWKWGIVVFAGVGLIGALIALLLWPEPPTRGAVEIISYPIGAKVKIDTTELAGMTPVRLEGVDPKLPHHVVVSYAGYQAYDRDVAFEPGRDTLELHVVLTALVGTLTVESAPDGADVLVNGRTRGKTPLTLDNLSIDKDLIVELRYPGFRSERRTLAWNPERKLQVSIPLEKQRR